MATLVLADAPFGDVASRAILTEAARAVPHQVPLRVATATTRTPPGFVPVPRGSLPPGVAQVLLTGLFLRRSRLEEALAVAGAAVAAGARLRVRNLALEDEAGRIDPPAGCEVLEAAERLEVRDHRTANILTLWRVAAPRRILAYPERHLASDPTLTEWLPVGRVVGLAIRGGAEMRKSWQPRLPAIARLLAGAKGWRVLPLPVSAPAGADDDLAATRDVAAATLPGSPVLELDEFTDMTAWRRNLTPERYKGLVGRCSLVLTNRDLPAAFAVGCGVPVIGVALGADRRIVSCLATLANDLPPGSALVHPAPEP